MQRGRAQSPAACPAPAQVPPLPRSRPYSGPAPHAAAPYRRVSPEELPGGRGRRKPSESLGGGGRMGDSKVKVAVRIRPMNRRGENRARPRPPQRRRQVPGAPLRGGRPVGSGCPAPGVLIRAGGRPAHPETLSSTRAPPVRDAPPLPSSAPRPGAPRAPRPGPLPLPPARPPRPAAPFRPLALSLPPALPGGLSLVPRPGLSSSFPHPFPWALASRVSAASLPASCQRGPRPVVGLTPPGQAGQPGTPKPHVTGPVALARTLVALGRKKWQGVWSTPSRVESPQVHTLLALLFHCLFLYPGRSYSAGRSTLKLGERDVSLLPRFLTVEQVLSLLEVIVLISQRSFKVPRFL